MTYLNATAHNTTSSYMSITEICNSDKTIVGLVGRTKHLDALQERNRYAYYNYQYWV